MAALTGFQELFLLLQAEETQHSPPCGQRTRWLPSAEQPRKQAQGASGHVP